MPPPSDPPSKVHHFAHLVVQQARLLLEYSNQPTTFSNVLTLCTEGAHGPLLLRCLKHLQAEWPLEVTAPHVFQSLHDLAHCHRAEVRRIIRQIHQATCPPPRLFFPEIGFDFHDP